MAFQPGKTRVLCRVLLTGLCSSAIPLDANAGAWLQPEGQGQIIFNPSAMVATQRFDRKGRGQPFDRFVKQDSQTLVEYGWNRHLTLAFMGSQKVESFGWQGENQRVSTTGLGGGLRSELFRQGNLVMSAQFTGLAQLERTLPAASRRFGPRYEVDARLLLGYGFDVVGISGFVEAQAAYRLRSGWATDELRLDLTVGLRPVPRVLLLLQSFNTLALQAEAGPAGSRSRQNKLQASAVLDVTATWSVQGGVFTSLAGRNTLREKGVTLGVWRKF